ncbi:MAG: hypothetical protein SGPRY_009152, partial [Prymnesium sp.]
VARNAASHEPKVSFFNNSRSAHERTDKLLSRIHQELYARTQEDSAEFRSHLQVLLSCADFKWSKKIFGRRVGISFEGECNKIKKNAEDAAKKVTDEVRKQYEAARAEVQRATRHFKDAENVIKDVRSDVTRALADVQDLPTTLSNALETAIKDLASLDGCKLVSAAETAINKVQPPPFARISAACHGTTCSLIPLLSSHQLMI